MTKSRMNGSVIERKVTSSVRKMKAMAMRLTVTESCVTTSRMSRRLALWPQVQDSS